MKQCECGCGELAPSATARFRTGHHRRKPDRWRREDRGHDTPCWVWQLALNAKGYGRLRVPGQEGKALAHRFYYERERGPIAGGRQLDHLCRQRDCVNPWHLEEVTPAENTRRGLNAKITAEVAEWIRGQVGPGLNQTALARKLGVSVSLVNHVVHGRNWQAGGKPARVLPMSEAEGRQAR